MALSAWSHDSEQEERQVFHTDYQMGICLAGKLSVWHSESAIEAETLLESVLLWYFLGWTSLLQFLPCTQYIEPHDTGKFLFWSHVLKK